MRWFDSSLPEKEKLCSYLEIECEFDGSGLFDGDVRYRIYLGLDECTSFDVPGNASINIQLMLTGDGLKKVTWKANADVSVTDGYLSGAIEGSMHTMSDLYVGEILLYEVVLSEELVEYLGNDVSGCALRLMKDGKAVPGLAAEFLDREGLYAELRCLGVASGDLYLYDPYGNCMGCLEENVNINLPDITLAEYPQWLDDEPVEPLSFVPECEAFIKEDVLLPAGVYDMHIAGIYYEDKRDNEVRYYTHEGDGKFIEEYNNSGRIVERCYGGNNIPMLSGAGAWCGSPAELARFVASIDGRDEIPDIISKEAVAQMTEYIDKDTFSLGWNDTDPAKGWNRTGTLAGTTALIKYFPDGECWILITNTSTWKGPGQARYTNELFKQCRELYSVKLPAINLFEEQPTCSPEQ